MNGYDLIKKIENETGIIFKVYETMEELRGTSAYECKAVICNGAVEYLGIYRHIEPLYPYFYYLTDVKSVSVTGLASSEELDCLHGFKNITSLDISNMSLKEVPEFVFEFKNLTNLNLGHNSIQRLPESIGNLTKLTSLSLEYNSINQLPDSIGYLVNLTSLDLDRNNCKNTLECVCNLTNLERLNLSENDLTELPEDIGNLINLKRLVLENNSLEKLPKTMGKLKNITYLDLWNNNFTEVPDCIKNFKNLENLYLGYNSITQLPDFIGDLTNLDMLQLSGNQLTELPESIGKLINLTRLYVADNSLATLPNSMGNLKSLDILDLENAEIRELPTSMAKLVNLTVLALNKTKIDVLPSFIFDLKRIKHLDISYNEFESLPRGILNFDVPFNFDKGYVAFSEHGIFMEELKLQEMDVAMFKKDRSHIKEFYDELERDSVLLNETRVIFIGNGDAGKTSIIDRLITGVPPQKSEGYGATKGILIKKHNFKITDGETPRETTVNFWDFGGQDIMHSMHEFFLSERCLYVIVLDGRRDEDPEKWLSLIKHYGKNSPVMVVMNKIDENPSKKVGDVKYGREYANAFSKLCFHNISCRDGDNFEQFEKDFFGLIKETKAYDKIFPGRWDRVKKKLANMKDRNYINESDFKKYCEEEGITAEFNQKVLLEWLHDLGVCFSFKSRNSYGVVEGLKVLRPEWITNGIYKIITSPKSANRNGFLPIKLIQEILESEKGENDKYNNVERDFVLGMMRDFDLSYLVDESEFIPMITEGSEPASIPIDYKNSIHFKIKYDELLPTGVLYKFVVHMRDYVNQEYTWREGCFLEDIEHYNCKALIRFGRRSDELHIYIEGDMDKTPAYLAHIISKIKNAQKNLSVNYKEYIEHRHINGKTAFVDCNRMLTVLKKGKHDDLIDELNDYVNVMDVLKSCYPHSVITTLEKLVRTKSDEIERFGNMQELVASINFNVSELSKQSKEVAVQLGKLNILQVHQSAMLKEFFDEHSGTIRAIKDDEILRAIEGLRNALGENNNVSAKDKMRELMSVLSDSASLGSATYLAAASPAVQEFFHTLTTRFLGILS